MGGVKERMCVLVVDYSGQSIPQSGAAATKPLPPLPESELHRIIERGDPLDDVVCLAQEALVMRQEHSRFKNTLEHYADESFYEPTRSGDTPPIFVDLGNMARVALGLPEIEVRL